LALDGRLDNASAGTLVVSAGAGAGGACAWTRAPNHVKTAHTMTALFILNVRVNVRPQQSEQPDQERR